MRRGALLVVAATITIACSLQISNVASAATTWAVNLATASKEEAHS